MALSKKCKLCDLFIMVDNEDELEKAVADHKASKHHTGNKEARKERKQEKRAKLLKKYYPDLLEE
mgnify:CR=1 FL=1